VTIRQDRRNGGSARPGRSNAVCVTKEAYIAPRFCVWWCGRMVLSVPQRLAFLPLIGRCCSLVIVWHVNMRMCVSSQSWLWHIRNVVDPTNARPASSRVVALIDLSIFLLDRKRMDPFFLFRPSNYCNNTLPYDKRARQVRRKRAREPARN
jgi:hypothetical protein